MLTKELAFQMGSDEAAHKLKTQTICGVSDVHLRDIIHSELEEVQRIFSQPMNHQPCTKVDLELLVGRHIERTRASMGGVEIPQVDRLIQLILKYRLYQNGWVLRDDIRDHHMKGGVIIGGAIKWIDGVAVGAVVIVDSIRRAGCYRNAYPDEKQLHVFVRKAHRRKGIGSELVSAIRDQFTPGTYAEIGVDGSEYFWGKMKVTVK